MDVRALRLERLRELERATPRVDGDRDEGEASFLAGLAPHERESPCRDRGDAVARDGQGRRLPLVEPDPPDADSPLLGVGVPNEGERARLAVDAPYARDRRGEGLADLDVVADAIRLEERDLAPDAPVAVHREYQRHPGEERHAQLRDEIHPRRSVCNACARDEGSGFAGQRAVGV